MSHMSGASASDALTEAKHNEELRFVECFPPAFQAQPFDHPICIFEVLPSRSPGFNFLFREGWSGPEDWGRWIDGKEARSLWVATARAAHQLSIQAFPSCVPGRQQQISFEVNGLPLASHRWVGCDTWSEDIAIPRDLVRVGLNEVIVRADYAIRPIDLSGGENPDPRALSVGFTRLRVDEAN